MFKIHINDGSQLPDDDVLYILSKNGLFLRKKLGIIESLIKVDKISILEDSQQYASFNIEEIPKKDFAHLVNFFKYVYNEYGSEAMSILHYNQKTDEHKIQIPMQKVSGSSVDYVKNVSFKTFDKIGTIHSHANFSAFHSSTDDHDEENWDGIHITVGNVDSEEFSIAASVVINGTRFTIEPEDYIEGIFESEKLKGRYYMHNLDVYEFPESWSMYVEQSTTRIDAIAALKKKFGISGRGLFDGVGNTYTPPKPYGKTYSRDIVYDATPGYNPCESCPFKGHKVEMQMQELLDELDEVDDDNDKDDKDDKDDDSLHDFWNIY